MNIKIYHTLPQESIDIRNNVFVEEQGFREEFDGIDHRAVHLVLFCDDIPAATCRFFKEQDTEQDSDTYLLGRMAVLKTYRGQDFGSLLLQRAEAEMKQAGAKTVKLHAQQRAVPFYEKNGYSAYGDIEPEEGYPHVWMMKRL